MEEPTVRQGRVRQQTSRCGFTLVALGAPTRKTTFIEEKPSSAWALPVRFGSFDARWRCVSGRKRLRVSAVNARRSVLSLSFVALPAWDAAFVEAVFLHANAGSVRSYEEEYVARERIRSLETADKALSGNPAEQSASGSATVPNLNLEEARSAPRRPIRLRIPRWGMPRRSSLPVEPEQSTPGQLKATQQLREATDPIRDQRSSWQDRGSILADKQMVPPDLLPDADPEGANSDGSGSGVHELPDSLSPESTFEHPMRLHERIRALTAPVMGWLWYMLFSRNWSAFLSRLSLVVALLILLRYGVNRSLRWLYKRFQSVDPKGTTLPFEDSVFESMQRPLEIFAVTLLGTYMAEAVSRPLAATGIIKYLHPLRELGIIIATTMFVLRWVNKIRLRFLRAPESQRRGIDQAQVDAVSRIVSVATVVVALLISLDTFGVNIQAVLAFGGIGGVAIGFAGREVISNFFSGFMIYLTRPFTVGEWIRSINEDDPIDGFVEDIGWYLTRVRTWEKRPLYIPNSKFSTLIIENPSRMTNRRIKKTLHLRIEDMHVVKTVVDEIRTMLMSHPDLDPKQHRMVYVEGFTEFSCNIWLSCYTKQVFLESYMKTQQDIMLKIHEILRKHGARLATTLVRDLRDGTNPDIYGAGARLRPMDMEQEYRAGAAPVEYHLNRTGAPVPELGRDRPAPPMEATGPSTWGEAATKNVSPGSTTTAGYTSGSGTSGSGSESSVDRASSKKLRDIGQGGNGSHGYVREPKSPAGALGGVAAPSTGGGGNTATGGSNGSGNGAGGVTAKRSEASTPPGGEARPRSVTTTQQGMIIRGDTSTSAAYGNTNEEETARAGRRSEDVSDKPSKGS